MISKRMNVFSGGKMKWMNPRPSENEAYVPTPVEHFANILTHGFMLYPIWYMVRGLWEGADNEQEKWAAGIYGAVLVGLFAVSTIFHTISYVWHYSFLKELFHRGDRAMIYLFIAGSYTPWLCLKTFPAGSWAQNLTLTVWVMAFMGIFYQQLYHEKYKWLETTFYVIIASLPSIAIIEMHDTSGVAELRYGGLVYLLGVIFFKLDGVIPFAHAIWHLHVVVGSTLHYYAVMTYLIDEELLIDQIEEEMMSSAAMLLDPQLPSLN